MALVEDLDAHHTQLVVEDRVRMVDTDILLHPVVVDGHRALYPNILGFQDQVVVVVMAPVVHMQQLVDHVQTNVGS